MVNMPLIHPSRGNTSHGCRDIFNGRLAWLITKSLIPRTHTSRLFCRTALRPLKRSADSAVFNHVDGLTPPDLSRTSCPRIAPVNVFRNQHYCATSVLVCVLSRRTNCHDKFHSLAWCPSPKDVGRHEPCGMAGKNRWIRRCPLADLWPGGLQIDRGCPNSAC